MPTTNAGNPIGEKEKRVKPSPVAWASASEATRFGRRADHCCETSQQSPVCHWHEQSTRRRIRPPRDVHDHWQHQRSDTDIIHEGRKDSARQHDDDDHAGLTSSCHFKHLPSDDIGNSCRAESGTENKHRPHRNHCRIAETGQCFFNFDKTSYRKRAENQQRNDIHAKLFRDKKHQRNSKNREDSGNLEIHITAQHIDYADRVCLVFFTIRLSPDAESSPQKTIVRLFRHRDPAQQCFCDRTGTGSRLGFTPDARHLLGVKRHHWRV